MPSSTVPRLGICHTQQMNSAPKNPALLIVLLALVPALGLVIVFALVAVLVVQLPSVTGPAGPEGPGGTSQPPSPVSPSPSPIFDPDDYLEGAPIGRGPTLPAIESPGQRSPELTEIDNGRGFAVSVPAWMDPHHTALDTVYASQDAWLNVARGPHQFGEPATLDGFLDSVGWRDERVLESFGDDSDFTIILEDPGEDLLKIRRHIVGEEQQVWALWQSPIGDRDMEEVARRVVESLRITEDLSIVLPAPGPLPVPREPVLHPSGRFAVPVPDGTVLAQSWNSAALFSDSYQLGVIEITYVPDGGLTPERAIEEAPSSMDEVVDQGEAPGEFWMSGHQNFGEGIYRHYIAGTDGYIAITMFYPSQYAEENRQALDTVLAGLQWAPLG